MAGAVGLSPYDTPRRMWRLLTGREEEEFSDFRQKMMDQGRHDEPYICNLFCQVTGMCVLPCSMWLSRYNPRMSASPDGIVFDPWTGVQSCLEIKRPYKALYTGVNISHYVQMQQQMHCTGLNSCYYVAWHPEDGLRIWLVLVDNAFIYDFLLDAVDEFLKYVDEDTQPPINKTRREKCDVVRTVSIPQHSFLVYSD